MPKNIYTRKGKECPTCKNHFTLRYIESHLKNRKKCLNCTKLFCVGKTGRKIIKDYGTKFCSRSCNAIYNNQKLQSNDAKRKRIISLKKYHEAAPNDSPSIVLKTTLSAKAKRKYFNKNIEGPYSKVFHVTCSHCDKIFLSRTKVKYCINHSHLYKSNNRNRYAFTFNVYEYPDLFDINLLDKIGWYSNGKRTKRPLNPNGLTRDHKISIAESIRNDYNPYYIKHLLNCEIMPFSQNNIKKTKSSITYEQLVESVDSYDSRNGL